MEAASVGRGGARIRESGDDMNKVLTAGIALVAFGTGVARAADLPLKAPPVPAYVPPPFSWTGCYIGGNVGGAWAQSNWSDSRFGLNWGNTSNGRFIGGGQVGCNYQFYNPGFVIGFEGEGDWAGNNNGNGVTAVLPRIGDTIRIVSNDTWLTTAAARFGYGWDHVLFYGKAGGGWVGNNGFTATDLRTGGMFTAGTNTISGWLVGAGIEYAFTNNWTVKVEYDYLGLPNRSFTIPGVLIPALAGDVISSNHNIQSVKVGLNYLFNWTAPAAPVATRY